MGRGIVFSSSKRLVYGNIGRESGSPWPRDSFLHPKWFSVESGWHVKCVEVISCLSGIVQRVNDCGIIFSLISLFPRMGGLTKEFILSSLWFKSFQCAEFIVLICAYNFITSCGTDLVRKCSFQFSLQIGNFPSSRALSLVFYFCCAFVRASLVVVVTVKLVPAILAFSQHSPTSPFDISVCLEDQWSSNSLVT